MKQVQSNNYNIAWFKLAECVSRGEKERALGMYRLLSHSIADQALVEQLEGDLLGAFADAQQAIIKYHRAIERYMQTDRWLEAAAVYEHIISLEPTNYEHYMRVIEIYHQLGIAVQVYAHIEAVLDILIKHSDDLVLQQALSLLETLNAVYYTHACTYLKK